MNPTGFAAQAQPSVWMPAPMSTSAPEVDAIFTFIFWVAFFFFALIVGVMTLFVLRYRRREGVEPGTSFTHSLPLELTWSLIPLGLVIIIFYLGFRGFMDLNTPPANSYEVLVTGQKWKWLFTYPNGYVDENLHVPVDVPIKLTMSSEDVIHSMYIPAFRVKKDVVPGRYSKLWFRAIQPGEYQIFCAEYCGKSHSDMLAKCIVHPPGEFEKWLENASNFLDRMSPVEAGERLFKSRGCPNCHFVDGRAGTGPTLKGIFGQPVTLKEGGKVPVDEDYIRESILDPQAKIVAGFDPVMPTFRGRLKDREITAIIEYIKSLPK